MTEPAPKKHNRRTFLKRSAIAAAAGAAAVGAGSYWLGSQSRVSRSAGKKVIVIGIDGLDPRLCERMMNERDARGRPRLPHLARLREQGGFSRLGTSIPPQSPVAWANFINGAGPGSHGIFDFIHRHPEDQGAHPFYGASETVPGEGYWDVGEHRLQLDFWPFNHKLASTELRRQGVPFWEYLDEAGIPSTFYDLPCNYPPSPSKHGHHRCLCGMGTPDMMGSGTYGTYQHFAEDGPIEPESQSGGRRCRLSFEGETARAAILGPDNGLLQVPRPTSVEFLVHRDRQANGAVIEIQSQRLLLRAGDWSRWIKINFTISTPWFVPSKNASGICRFYLQEVAPNCRLYVTPVNVDPSDPLFQISEPPSFVQGISEKLGLFYTTGFQEDYSARKNNVFVDDEFVRQAGEVLEERLALFRHAVHNYDDGLLFFYFSSSDLQSHMLWWNSDDEHPVRTAQQAERYFQHIHRLYQRLDQVIGDIVDRYGSQATILVMSDHGFANFGRQFNLNTWLRDHAYLGPPDCTSLMSDVDWSQTRAYGLGINGLYLNLRGRERDGIVEPDQKDALLAQLVRELEAVQDENGDSPIRRVYRTDQEASYRGDATALAPDLIIGYSSGYRASWATILGDITPEILLNNDSAWSADHCADALEVPGVLFSNRPLRRQGPYLWDVAPSILAEFGLPTPSGMIGRSVL
jgi:predicted AlkP superfamily phosphohydrolase/phosphomutase